MDLISSRRNKKSEHEKPASHILHPFEPFYDENSEILILGSFPSVASRADGFYYGNPRNRFWKVLEAVLEEKDFSKAGAACEIDGNGEKNISIQEKKSFLLRHKIALYDSISECTIYASSDSSIRDVRPADIKSIVEKSKVKKIFANGKTAQKFFVKYQSPELCALLTVLPSTSPANASFSLEDLIKAWKAVAEK